MCSATSEMALFCATIPVGGRISFFLGLPEASHCLFAMIIPKIFAGCNLKKKNQDGSYINATEAPLIGHKLKKMNGASMHHLHFLDLTL